MKYIGVQMTDNRISSEWWKELVKCFVKENRKLQIRCWNEELDEIKSASKYGASHTQGYETCIDGITSTDFITELLNSDEPKDKAVYNKMTKYFTINVSDGKNIFESAHYGTEMYIALPSEAVCHFYEIMNPHIDSFSISIGDI